MLVPASLAPLGRVPPAPGGTANPATSAVRLERNASGQPRLIVTDGRLLLIAEFEEPVAPDAPPSVLAPGAGVSVPARVFRAACKLARGASVSVSRGALAAPNDGPPKAFLEAGGVALAAEQPWDCFPNWRAVLESAAATGPALNLDAAAQGKYLSVSFGVDLWLKLLETLRDLGLDTIQLEIPVDAPGLAAGGLVRFTALCGGGGEFTVRGLLVPLAQAELPARVWPAGASVEAGPRVRLAALRFALRDCRDALLEGTWEGEGADCGPVGGNGCVSVDAGLARRVIDAAAAALDQEGG